ncbi:MAG: CBS domain-containing protein [Clostridiales bacterium]|jgi:CBS domain-containing protein|nr:CBS domain-containing protein [Clostridiales bacterium]
MNVAFYLTPKSSVVYLYGDQTVKQGLEKMKSHGYTAVPVIDRDGKYIGVATEGDFLWFMYDLIRNGSADITTDMKAACIQDVINTQRFNPVPINISDEELILTSLNENFVPVIDDREIFIGIVTRKSIISKMAEKRKKIKELQR